MRLVILRHCDKHKIITDAQHGCRKRRSCETQLVLTIQDLAKSVGNRGQTDIILLDFSKAFEEVPVRYLVALLMRLVQFLRYNHPRLPYVLSPSKGPLSMHKLFA
jgi:hypothetical protein